MIEACDGADYDNDGLRDLATSHSLPAKLITPYSFAAGFISDIWCLQLVIERLLALEEAFGEPLPRSRVVVWVSRLLNFWIALLAGTPFISRLASMLVSIGVVLGLGGITVYMWLAYSVPLAALQAARKLNAETDDLGALLFQKEAMFAVRVIRAAQAGIVLASASMSWHFGAYGISWVVTTQEWSDGYQYGVLADTLGNLICLFLLAGSALRLPRVQCRICRPAARDEDGERLKVDACTCGKQVGKTSSQRSGSGRPSQAVPDQLCDHCARDEKVAELGSRRISVDDLLTFYTRLNAQEPVMPHFDAERSTTNNVVRHAIIPESRDGDLGYATRLQKFGHRAQVNTTTCSL